MFRNFLSQQRLHSSTKRSQCNSCQFKVLFAPGNADYGDEQQQAKRNMRDGDPQSKKDHPDQVHDGGEASTGHFGSHGMTAKWP